MAEDEITFSRAFELLDSAINARKDGNHNASAKLYIQVDFPGPNIIKWIFIPSRVFLFTEVGENAD